MNAIGSLTAPLEQRQRRADGPMREAAKDNERDAARRPLPPRPRRRPWTSGFAAQSDKAADASRARQEGRRRQRGDGRRRSRSRSRPRPAPAPRSSACRRRGPTSGRASTSTSGAPTRRASASSSTPPSSSSPRATATTAPSACARSPTSPSSTCRTARCCACSPIACSRRARSTPPCRSSSASLELAPNEPQSHRDLGLALADAGQAQAAVDRLYAVVTGAWDARFADVDLIALTELNAVVDKSRRDGRGVDVGAIDKRLLQKHAARRSRRPRLGRRQHRRRPARRSTPTARRCSTATTSRTRAARSRRDATGGYGPEEFALRIAKPGKYRVEANFFGHRQQVLTTGTGLMMWLSSGFAHAGAAGSAHDDPRQERSRRARRRRRVRGEGGQQDVSAGAEIGRWFASTTPSCRPGAASGVSATCRPRPGLRGELRRDRLDLVLAHVVVHVAPAGEDGGAIGLLVDRVAVLDRPAGVAAGRSRSPCRRPRARRRPSRPTRCRACRSRPEHGAAKARTRAKDGRRMAGRAELSPAISAACGEVETAAGPGRAGAERRGPARISAVHRPAIASSRATRSSVAGWVENRPRRPPP